MQTIQSGRIHPLMAGAAASVMLVSLVGAAAITGILPSSHGTDAPAAPIAAAPATQAATPGTVPAQAVAAAPAVEHKTVVHHRYVTHVQPAQVAQVQAAPAPSYSQQPAPRPQADAYHPVGIGVGAVVGGLLGSQVGGGNGRTLATIAGAVGGGYVGNEVAKRNQQ
ncbi:glycine zipper 2TM domain-containing protein [Oxalobacteraceae bacterium OM1]|nr:glycine zipper 2TM domain-containing protein [Oxalobacteraceae bacterium OM1]